MIIILIVLTGLIIASVTDLKTREVPDWLSYGLICAGIGINLLFSIIYWDYRYILYSALGLGAFLAIALLMFYSGQWGGGDSKVLMGLGALIGLKFDSFPFLASLLINILIAGALYGIAWTFFLAFRKRQRFILEYRKTSSKTAKARVIAGCTLVMSAPFVFYFSQSIFAWIFFSAAVMSLITFYLWMAIKAVEKVCMIKKVTPDKLTEGDWIVKDVKYKGKYLCGPKDLGIEKKQIREVMKLYRAGKIKKVLIKEGIPFIPSFLL